ncbi:MAG: UDP-N-acetylmuramate dehydrogenase [Clostridia bacterium]|nr:UDP-N-acetylmuramate dehydrogenase [Clostridia bacterium]
MKSCNCLSKRLLSLGARKNVPARNYTSFRIGGPMAYFAEPANIDELIALLNAAKEAEYPVYVIGNGSNLLVSDEGAKALFIKIGPKMSNYSVEGTTVRADGGALLCTVAKASVAAGLSGLEWASGIPGTVGGGVAMNAGAYQGEIKQVIRRVGIIEDGIYSEREVADDDLGYRRSAFAWPKNIVVSAEFELRPDDGTAVELVEKYTLLRRQKQPIEMPSAGSTFKRPVVEGLYAGALIEQCDLKGTRIGGAMVSPKHAGFIVNCGGATFADVTALIQYVTDTVKTETGVLLEPEVKIIYR